MRWSRSLRLGLLPLAVALALLGCAHQRQVQPQTDVTWQSTPASPLSPRYEATGAWAAGRFFVVGGTDTPPCGPTASCAAPERAALRDGAVFDPVAGTWAAMADAPVPVNASLSAVVVENSIFLTSNDVSRQGSTRATLRYDVATDHWSTLPDPPAGEWARLVAAGDRLLAISGSDEQGIRPDAWFDQDAGTWRELPEDPLGPSYGRDAVWLDGQLMLAAAELVANPGGEKPAVARLAVLDGQFRRWRDLGPTEIIGGSPQFAHDHVVWPSTGTADGGATNNWGRPYAFGGIYEPASRSWTPLPTPPTTQSGLAGFLGTVGKTTLVDGHLLDPASGAWTTLPASPWPLARSGETVITGAERILVWGGHDEEKLTNQGFLTSKL